ncbi:MAG: MarR family transcriptional regulator [Deltaproteobacteria bacterium]|nr:MAG: MarR family transcriptional regulator [Deltaproteobacteria bacterium]
MPFKDCLCFLVGKVARKMSRTTRERLIRYGLTPTQFFLLTALYEEDGIPISALAQKVALDKATLTGLLDRLERDGFTWRKADSDDRRAIRIHLTAKAESLREELTELYHDNNGMFLSLLSQEEKEVFERVVNKLETAEF